MIDVTKSIISNCYDCFALLLIILINDRNKKLFNNKGI
jgi:hypothetical protein